MTDKADAADRVESSELAKAKEPTDNTKQAVKEGLEEASSNAKVYRQQRRGGASDFDTGQMVKVGALPPKPEFFDSSVQKTDLSPSAVYAAGLKALDASISDLVMRDLVKPGAAGDTVLHNNKPGESSVPAEVPGQGFLDVLPIKFVGPILGVEEVPRVARGPRINEAPAEKPSSVRIKDAPPVEGPGKESPHGKELPHNHDIGKGPNIKIAEGDRGAAKAPEKAPDKAPEKVAEKPADPEAVKKALKEFDDGQHWYKADDFDKMNKALAGKKPEELKAMEAAFKAENKGQSIEDYLRDRWKEHPEELKKALDSLHAGQGQVDDASLKQAAKQIDGAMNTLTSDNYKTVVSALENRSPKELQAINEAFKIKHGGKGIEDYLQDRWKEHPEELKKVLELLHPGEKVADPAVVNKALKEFDDGQHSYKADDFDKMNRALAGKKPEELKAMEVAFKKEHKEQSIEDYLRDRWKDHPEELKKALDALQAGKGPVDDASVKQAAKQIDGAMNTLTSDNYKTVVSALENRSPKELQAINEAFKKEHDGKGIEVYLQDRWEEHPEELKKVLELLHPGEKVADPAVVNKALKEFDDGQHWYKADDFDKMNKALAGKKPEELKAMEDAFKKEHNGQSIENYLRDRWKEHPEELKKALDALHAADKKVADPAVVNKALKEFDDGQHSFKADDFEKMNKALAGKKPEELEAMEVAFKKEHNGQSIEDYLRDRWKEHPEELKKALDALQAGKGPVDDASVKQAAKQIDGAMNTLTSDNYKTVVSALENRSPEELQAINEAFKIKHGGKGIEDYLQNRWKEHPEELKKVLELLHPGEKVADPAVVKKALQELDDGQHTFKADDFDKMHRALAGKKPEELKAMEVAFKKEHKEQSIEDYLRDRWKDHPEELRKALDALDAVHADKGKVDDASVKQATKQIDGAMNLLASDNYRAVTSALENRSPAELTAINEAFKKEHDGKGLEDYLQGRWKEHPEELKKALELLHPGEKVADPAVVNKALKEFDDGQYWYQSDDFDKMNRALAGKKPEELKAMEDAFKKEHHGQSIEDYLRGRWKKHPEELKKALDALQKGNAVEPQAGDKQGKGGDKKQAKEAGDKGAKKARQVT